MGLQDVFDCFTNLNEIDCSNLSFYELSNEKEVNRALSKVASANHLHKITANDMQDINEAVVSIAERCKSLRHLDLCGCERVSSASICAVAACCPELRYLNIFRTAADSTAVTAVGRNCPALTHINIGDIVVSAEAYLALGKGCPDLIYLFCDALHDEHFIAIGQYCTNLKTLLAKFSRATEVGLASVMLKCPNLTTLDVSYADHISSTGLLSLSSGAAAGGFPLRRFFAADCPSMDDNAVYELVASCPRLQLLDVCSCPLTDATAWALADYGENLTQLNINSCYSITNNDVIVIAKHCKRLMEVSLVLHSE